MNFKQLAEVFNHSFDSICVLISPSSNLHEKLTLHLERGKKSSREECQND